jgi:hypothetical protein
MRDPSGFGGLPRLLNISRRTEGVLFVKNSPWRVVRCSQRPSTFHLRAAASAAGRHLPSACQYAVVQSPDRESASTIPKSAIRLPLPKAAIRALCRTLHDMCTHVNTRIGPSADSVAFNRGTESDGHQAVQTARLTERVTSHTFRHSFATPFSCSPLPATGRGA